MKKCLSWPVFSELSEINIAPLNVMWFILGATIAYQEYHLVNLVNILLCLADVFLFDLAVNIADNYFDFIHGKDPHFLQETNPVGRLHLPLTGVRELVILMYAVSALPGLILVYRTGWPVLVMGIIGYIVGIFYTAGPKPLNAMPICEAIVAFFISYFIILVSVYISVYGQQPLTWTLAWRTLLHCLPVTCIFYSWQLSNNTCDLQEDLINGRHTLASYIGVKRSVQLMKSVIMVGMLLPVVLAVFRIAPWPIALTSLLLPFLWKRLRPFFDHPDKQKTYPILLKNTSLFFIAYILLYAVLIW